MRLLTAGCSFSACGSTIEEAKVKPEAWPHFLVNHLGVDRFANLSIPGTSNTALVNNLIYFLETKPDWNPTNTLVGFNITELHRIDTMCSVDHPDANKDFSWNQDLQHGWLSSGSFVHSLPPFNGALQKNMGFEQIVKTNCLELLKLFTYLEYRKFSYFYMFIDNIVLSDSPEWFQTVLHRYKNRQALSTGMAEHSKQNNAIDNDGWHPSKEAHQLIANEIFSFLNMHQLTKNIN